MHNAALGVGATVADTVAAKTATLQKQQMQGAGLSDEQYANSTRLIKSQADGTYALQGQVDAINVQNKAMQMGAAAGETFRIVQTKINDNFNAGRPLLDGITEKYLTLAKAQGAGTVEGRQISSLQKEQFTADTMFMSPSELAQANAAHGIDPVKWREQLDQLGPSMAAFNQELKPATSNVAANKKTRRTGRRPLIRHRQESVAQRQSMRAVSHSALCAIGMKIGTTSGKRLNRSR